MKKPLFSLTVFSSVFLAIILFCVILGGYTNLLRAKNRIKDAKEMVITQCQKRLDHLPELIDLAKKTHPSGEGNFNISDKDSIPTKTAQLTKAANQATAELSRFSSTTPSERKAVSAFEQSQAGLGQAISLLLAELKKTNTANTPLIALEKDFQQLGLSIWVTSNRYNKEARFFNDKKGIFPGSLSAKLFGLGKTQFFEITASLFQPEDIGVNKGAS